MMRERIVRAALLAYPQSTRDAHGAEMFGTALDAGDVSVSRLAREIVDLAWSGSKARIFQTGQIAAPRLVADGLCIAGVWMLTIILAGDLGDRVRGLRPGDPEHPSWLVLSLVVVALGSALVGRERLAGVTALLFSALVVPGTAGNDFGDRWRLAMLVPTACFVALVVVPRHRRRHYRRLTWLLPVLAIALTSSLSGDSTAAILIVAFATLVPVSLLLLPVDPRPAVACAVCSGFFGVAMAQDQGGPGPLGLVFLLAAPAIILTVVLRGRYLQTRTIG